jgi:hypothetical protein
VKRGQKPGDPRLEESELAGPLEGVGPRGNAELAVDRPDVAVKCVVRHIQFLADVALGQIAAQQLEHPALTPRQLPIPGAGVHPRGPSACIQPPGQAPRIAAGSDDGSGLGDRCLRALELVKGTAVPIPGAAPPSPAQSAGPGNARLRRHTRSTALLPRGFRARRAILRAPAVPRRWRPRCRAHGTYSAAPSASIRCSSRWPSSPAMSER